MVAHSKEFWVPLNGEEWPVGVFVLDGLDGSVWRRRNHPEALAEFFDGLVVAATHGKGVYSIDIPAGTPVDESIIPRVAQLGQNVPNPFNPMTTIKFNLPASGKATLAVFDVAGKRVRTLVDGTVEQGDHQVTWNGADDGGRPAAAGVYLYRLDSGAIHEVKRMTLVR